MKKYLFVLMALVLCACGSSCQKFAGDPVSKNFAAGGYYTAIEVQDAFDVIVSDVTDSITITVGEKVMPYVIVEVVDNTLKIRLKSGGAFYGGEQKAIIPFNADLTKVDLSGASEFHTTYGLEGDKVKVELSGASDFYGDIIADELELNLSGASDAKLSGEVGILKIALSGSSNIIKQVNGYRYALGCERCEGTMSGASDAYIHCDGIIKVDLSGASELHFTGSGNPADSSTSGASEISHDVLP